MNVLSCFDGIACARVALDKAKIPIEKYYASEIDINAMRVATKNWKDIWEVGSILGLLESGWIDEPMDLLIGGSPCQDLSIAKKGREGLQGKRSGLFYEFVRILEALKPKWFILENVASMDNTSKDEITRLLGVEPIMINAALVSAQNRKRYFWTNIPNVTLPEDKGILLKDILESDVDKKYFIQTPNLKRNNGKSMQWDTSNKGYLSQQDRAYSVDSKLPTVPHNRAINKVNVFAVASRGRTLVEGKRKDVVGAKTEQRMEIGSEKANTITKVYKDSMVMVKEKTNTIRKGGRGSGLNDRHNWDTIIVPEATVKGYAEAKEGDSVDFSFPNSKTRRGRVGNKAKTIMTSPNVGVVSGGYVRRLTPIEVERCFGVPDNYTAYISESKRYDALGNAFNADVIAHILSFIPNKSRKKKQISN